MAGSVTVRRQVAKRSPRKARATVPAAAAPRIPRISRLMAFAIVAEEMVRGGEVKDFAELARLGQVSPARISQVMGLLNLAPAIQEQILNLPPTADGRERITERSLRSLLNSAHWVAQVQSWEDMKGDANA